MAPFDKLRAHSGRQAPVILKPMISGLIAGQMIRSGHFYGHRTARERCDHGESPFGHGDIG